MIIQKKKNLNIKMMILKYNLKIKNLYDKKSTKYVIIVKQMKEVFMKFEKIDGVQYIVLEENDRICITTPDELDKTQVEIKEKDKRLDISGNSSIVSSIRGEGMLEKVYIPPVVSSKEIIEKCDNWFDMFKKVHDTFKKIVLTDEYRKQNVVMELSFANFFSFSDSNIKGRIINLDLKQYGTILKEGVTISIDEANEDVYSYLAACVLDYYVSQNLGDKEIDLLEFNSILYSNEKYERGATVPMLAMLGSLTESQEYYKIVASILGNHNIGESSEQIISNLRNRISNQQIGDRMDSSISHSSNQCDHILKKTLNSKKQQ